MRFTRRTYAVAIGRAERRARRLLRRGYWKTAIDACRLATALEWRYAREVAIPNAGRITS